MPTWNLNCDGYSWVEGTSQSHLQVAGAAHYAGMVIAQNRIRNKTFGGRNLRDSLVSGIPTSIPGRANHRPACNPNFRETNAASVSIAWIIANSVLCCFKSNQLSPCKNGEMCCWRFLGGVSARLLMTASAIRALPAAL